MTPSTTGTCPHFARVGSKARIGKTPKLNKFIDNMQVGRFGRSQVRC